MDISSPYHILLSKKDRVKLFCQLYWRTIVIIITPIVLIPVACIGYNDAYTCFYIFLVTGVFWIADVLPACVTALVPVALMTIFGILSQFHMRNNLLNCFGVMAMIVAIERCQVFKRLALKLLIIFGCSHYRLSFLLFFTTMFLSIWISNTIACGLMMPLVKSILTELEMMGILEMYSKLKSLQHEQKIPCASDLTIFYFLGLSYSASIGGMATILGSETNQIFKIYCETLFISGPKIEFPHFMLLNLPGVILIECLLYMWMNFYFLGMFRTRSEIALQIGMTEEEALYLHTLLTTQYTQLGKIKFHEAIVGVLVIITMILHTNKSSTYLRDPEYFNAYSNIKVTAPTIIIVLILFLVPVDLNFLKFFRKNHGTDDRPLPKLSSKACLNWRVVNNNMHWSVLIIVGGSSAMFEALKHTDMTMEFEKFLLLFSDWPAPAIVLVIIIFCKILTEFAPNSCLAYCLLPHVARLMYAGIGPSIIVIVVTWFTVTIWSKAIWTDIFQYPAWADHHIFKDLSPVPYRMWP